MFCTVIDDHKFYKHKNDLKKLSKKENLSWHNGTNMKLLTTLFLIFFIPNGKKFVSFI